ncbi:uncharacterized protein C8R40DRAFT_1071701 [Lentinula edodes]|uniref:uncharacterized protein n=1 Tax=Lentinula edodes TaxID=5353 RepID=UPI001E8CE80E|nr:uncharacterized protein C8R40DRAFT_1071701 [Lentinula edodes]KAH7872478.1 hypothetical protein C8R40DRAFT_1071701 [Lentinula edodes]
MIYHEISGTIVSPYLSSHILTTIHQAGLWRVYCTANVYMALEGKTYNKKAIIIKKVTIITSKGKQGVAHTKESGCKKGVGKRSARKKSQERINENRGRRLGTVANGGDSKNIAGILEAEKSSAEITQMVITLTASGEHDAALSAGKDTERSRDLQFVSSSPRHFDENNMSDHVNAERSVRKEQTDSNVGCSNPSTVFRRTKVKEDKDN